MRQLGWAGLGWARLGWAGLSEPSGGIGSRTNVRHDGGSGVVTTVVVGSGQWVVGSG